MKILVTGANGYLGRGITKQLIDLGHQVIAVDVSVDSIDERTTGIASDIFNEASPFETFCEPDCLLHLAWQDGFKHYSDTHIDCLPKHKCFIEKMCSSGLKSIAIMGTMHEIGFYEGSIDDNTPCRPLSYYGIAKNALRDVTAVICKKYAVEFKWLRAFYIVGGSPNGCSIFSKIVQTASNKKKEFPFTTGQNQYDFLDYEAFCRQVSLAISQNEINGIINICSGRPEKLSHRVERFIQENGFDIELKYGAFPDRPYDSKALWGNSKKIDTIMEMFENGTDQSDKSSDRGLI